MRRERGAGHELTQEVPARDAAREPADDGLEGRTPFPGDRVEKGYAPFLLPQYRRPPLDRLGERLEPHRIAPAGRPGSPPERRGQRIELIERRGRAALLAGAQAVRLVERRLQLAQAVRLDAVG